MLLSTSLWLIFTGCRADIQKETTILYHLLESNDSLRINDFLKNKSEIDAHFYTRLIDLKNSKSIESLDSLSTIIYSTRNKFSLFQNKILKQEKEIKHLELVENHYQLKGDTCLRKLIFNNQKSETEFYQFIRYLNLKARSFYENSEYLNSQIYISYAIHLMHKKEWQHVFPKLYLKILQNQRYLWFIDKKNPIETKALNNSILDFASQNDIDDYEDYSFHWKNDENNVPISAYQDEVEYVLSDSIPIEDKSQTISLLLDVISLPRDSILFNKTQLIIQNRKKSPCDGYHLNDLMNIARIFAQNKQFKKARDIMEASIKEANNWECTNSQKALFSFIEIDAKIEYYLIKFEHSNNEEDLDKCMMLLSKKNSLTKKILKNTNSEHLDDSNVLTTIETIEIATKYNTIPKQKQNQILQALYISKAQELKENYINHDTLLNENLSKINYQILKCISKTRDWKILPNGKNEVYKNIYNLSIEKDSLEKKEAQNRSVDTTAASMSNLEIDEIQTALAQINAQLIEYVTFDTTVYAVFINEAKFEIRKMDTLSINKTINHILNKIYKGGNYNDFSKSKSILVPFQEIDPNKKTIILKDGAIAKIPFEIFFPDMDIEYHYDLIKAISITKETIYKSNIALYSYSDETTHKTRKKRKWIPLLHGWSAILNIQAQLNTPNKELYSGYNMTFNNFKKTSRNKGIHIITHAINDTETKNNSQLIFRTENQTIDSVSQLDLEYFVDPPQFIFLDACATGTGKISVGEGTHSLGRIFLKKGTTTIIKTLWPIKDEQSGELAKIFYKEWLSGKSAGKALNQARKKLKAKYPNPYHWAPFVLEGNPNLYLK